MVAPMEKDPAMLFFGRDFYEDEAVKLMSLEQEAVYMRLLWHAWREGSLPSGIPALAAVAGVEAKRFARIWTGIEAKWKPNGDGTRLVNARQERERTHRAETRKRQSEGGRIGNAKRWGNRSPTDGDTESGGIRTPIASQSQSQVLLSPSGPDAGEHSSCCTGDEQDDSGSGSGPAGPSETSDSEIAERKALFEALRLSSYRLNARDRIRDLTDAAARLQAAGIDPDDLITLARKAQRRGKKPAGLWSSWIDDVPEALKELSKR